MLAGSSGRGFRFKRLAFGDEPARELVGTSIEGERGLLRVAAARIDIAAREHLLQLLQVAPLQQRLEILGKNLLLRLRHGPRLPRPSRAGERGARAAAGEPGLDVRVPLDAASDLLPEQQ